MLPFDCTAIESRNVHTANNSTAVELNQAMQEQKCSQLCQAGCVSARKHQCTMATMMEWSVDLS